MSEFNNLNDLYNSLTPAFDSKIRELKNLGMNYIQKVDIWNYLTINKWSKSTDLNLYNMVDDIFSLDNDLINNYVLNLLKQEKRKIEEMDVL